MAPALRLQGRPERIFVSVDESTGKSTISFQPPNVGTPVQHEDDKTGSTAMQEARQLSAKYPGCTVHGPHFHAARPPGGRWKRRRTEPTSGGGGGGSDEE
jgi:hypothetical protein